MDVIKSMNKKVHENSRDTLVLEGVILEFLQVDSPYTLTLIHCGDRDTTAVTANPASFELYRSVIEVSTKCILFGRLVEFSLEEIAQMGLKVRGGRGFFALQGLAKRRHIKLRSDAKKKRIKKCEDKKNLAAAKNFGAFFLSSVFLCHIPHVMPEKEPQASFIFARNDGPVYAAYDSRLAHYEDFEKVNTYRTILSQELKAAGRNCACVERWLSNPAMDALTFAARVKSLLTDLQHRCEPPSAENLPDDDLPDLEIGSSL